VQHALSLPGGVSGAGELSYQEIFSLSRAGAGQPQGAHFSAIVRHIHAAGPPVKVELVTEAGDPVQVEITQEPYRELCLQRNVRVFVTPKKKEATATSCSVTEIL